jgi:hypothetical protein
MCIILAFTRILVAEMQTEANPAGCNRRTDHRACRFLELTRDCRPSMPRSALRPNNVKTQTPIEALESHKGDAAAALRFRHHPPPARYNSVAGRSLFHGRSVTMSDNREWTDNAVQWARRLADESWRSGVSVRSVEEDADVFAVFGPVAEFQATIKRLSTAKLTTVGIGKSWPAVFVMFVRANNQAAVDSAVCEPTSISPS